MKAVNYFRKTLQLRRLTRSGYASDVDRLERLLQATTILISDISRARFEPE